MGFHARVLRLAYAACLAVAAGLVGVSPAESATTYSGRAYAVFVNVNTPVTGPVYVSDTGPLPPGGGFQSASLLTTRGTPVESLLVADVLNASTSGASGKANSSASLATVTVTAPGAPAIRATVLRAQTEATCGGISGSSEIAELTVGGESIAVTGAPNQTVSLPGGVTLVLNEQQTTTNGTYRQMTVNAVHLRVPGVAEVILASAHSDINCVPPTPQGPCHDFVTGGGWIPTDGRGHFGFNAGFKAGSTTPVAHLHYIDQAASYKVKGTGVTAYVLTTPTSRKFEGPCEINGVPGFTYSIEVADNGEPGRADTFRIVLSNGYVADGTLAGGNIQLHKPCR